MKNKQKKLQRLITESPFQNQQIAEKVKCSGGELSKVASGYKKPHRDLAYRIAVFFDFKILPDQLLYSPAQYRRIRRNML